MDNYRRSYDIDLNFVEGSLNHVALSVIEYIKLNSISGPVLLFSNTRDEAWYMATILKNQQSIKVDIHHGSLSRDIREEAEDKLKKGSRRDRSMYLLFRVRVRYWFGRSGHTLWLSTTSLKASSENSPQQARK